MVKRYVVKAGEKITVEIDRKSKVPSSKFQVPSSKGIIKTRRDDDYLARRLSSGITFYDLGLTKTGDVYADIDSQVVKPWTNTGGVGLPFPEPFGDDDYAARDAFALANLATSAQITPDYTSSNVNLLGAIAFDDDTIELGAASSVWSSKGLKVTATQLNAENISLFIGSFGFFDEVRLKGDGANKITIENSYDADAVEFNLQGKDKIYLVPAYCLSFLDEQFDDHLGFFNFVQQLNYFFLFFPRVPILNGIAPAAIDGKDLPNARVMRSTQDTFGGTFTNTELPASAFESASTNSIFGTETPEGFLIAVIKRGENVFYVWKD